MGTITAAEVIQSVAATLLDDDGIRWTGPERMRYLNDGQREAVILNPGCHSQAAVVPLVPGTRQTLPAEALALITVNANMGEDGATPGRAVTFVHRPVLDQAMPDWRSTAPSLIAKNYLYDDRNPRSFEVFPPQPDPAGHVEVTFSSAPPEITEDDPITLPDAYQTALYYYCLARAYSREGGTSNAAKGNNYYAMFQRLVTGRFDIKNIQQPTQAQRRTRE